MRNKKILNLCLRWHILRSYRFSAEVTFKIIFCSEFSDIPDKADRVTRRRLAIAKRFAFYANAIMIWSPLSNKQMLFTVFSISLVTFNQQAGFCVLWWWGRGEGGFHLQQPKICLSPHEMFIFPYVSIATHDLDCLCPVFRNYSNTPITLIP